ncbi:urease accessory protein UreD [Streptomyces sp. NPDC006186]|uniref:urease accessory protein UreD n=1 Tax=Streptomyces sp. NPDC006186 TaxID=3155248 RepID=UPI0033BAB30E
MSGTGGGVRARARVLARRREAGGTCLPVLESDGPLALRRTRGSGDEARVVLVGAMSGPHDGDRFRVDAEAEAGARLRVQSAAATLALPGQGEGEARYDVRVRVAAGAEVCWMPEPLISVRGSRLRMRTTAEAEAGGRLVLREEQILGRAGEEPGRLISRLTVCAGGVCLLDQELDCGPGAPGGWDGPAVLAGHRAVGQIVVVRPEFAERPVTSRRIGDTCAVLPLAGPAALVTAVAADGLRLRRLLDDGLAAAG